MAKIMLKILAAAIACAAYLPAYPQQQIPLIVGIVVQQMRYDAITRYGTTMGENGFKRIMKQGAYCTNAYYEYMLTEPQPAYATIYTGANPCSHGIISRQWYDRLSRKTIYAVGDTKYEATGSESASGMASPLKLQGTTLGDELKLSNFKQSKVISVSWDNYSSILPAGRLGDGAYWFCEHTGNMISSTYYMKSLPKWVNDFNGKRRADSYLQRTWNTSKDISEYRASLPDNSMYENGIEGQSVFPYNIKQMSKGKDYQLLKYTPWSNDLILEFAVEAIEKEQLGRDEFTDMLMINFAQPGYVSDIYGIRSVELQDSYIRLDHVIATLLSTLDQKLGRGNYLVFLTADRGASDSPLFLSDLGMPARQINIQGTMILLEAYLRALYGDDHWIEKYTNHQVYLNHLAVERYKLPLGEVQDMASQFLTEIDGIDHAMPAKILLESHTSTGIWKQAANNINRDRSGDIIINLAPGWQEITGTQGGDFSCSAQNSAYNHDTHVPLAFYGNSIVMTTVNRRVSIADITPTLATILRILCPDYSSGEPIHEIF